MPTRLERFFTGGLLSFVILAGMAIGLTGSTTAQIVPDEPDPLSPAAAVKAFDVPAGFSIELVVAEPNISQPVFFNFDERGRLWVMNYLQYPNPAGLRMLSRDKFWRAVYDKVPTAPPNHDRGADKITIHEDTDGDGIFDKHKTFLDGLSIATSFARGRGGVWVLNPPFLLFYPDADNDDVPDGDPVVHLEGFGIEDTHSCANSLRWGPDGWLYAGQGSTVTGNVKKPGDEEGYHSLGQLIWRYHPTKKIYEVFAEGGGNTFGVEFDKAGRVFSGHNGGNTRGFHFVQGGYSQKGFGKHGPLSNPFTFGYFAQMKHHDVARFVHNFVIYDSDTFPESHRGDLYGVEPMQGQIVRTKMIENGTSFETKDIQRIVKTDDTWFRPVDIKVGPDGSIYFADFYEPQISHREHFAGQIDRERGRIFRIVPEKVMRESFDLSALSARELLNYLEHPKKWFRQTALRRLYDLKDASIIGQLESRLSDDDAPVEMLWALQASGRLTLKSTFTHANPLIREWSVRLLGDVPSDASIDSVESELVKLAANERNAHVRSQIVATLQRIDTNVALRVMKHILRSPASDSDCGDIHIPLLVWWAFEKHCTSNPEPVIKFVEQNPWLWENRMFTSTVAERLMRRFAMSGTRKDYGYCVRIFAQAKTTANSKLLMQGFELAFKGRSMAGLPEELTVQLAKAGGESLTFRLRQKDPSAIEQATNIIRDATYTREKRLEVIETFGEIGLPTGEVLAFAIKDNDEAIQIAALNSSKRFSGNALAETTIEQYPQLSENAKEVANSMLASRLAWSLLFLEAVEQQKIDAALVPRTMLQNIAVHGDRKISDSLKKLFGEIKGNSSEEIQVEIKRVASVLRVADQEGLKPADPFAGKTLYVEACAKCHRLFGEGGAVGPDLTTFNRSDTTNMVINIVNPSAEIREGFENYKFLTEDGQVVMGFIADQDSRVVVVQGIDGQTVTLNLEEIEDSAVQKTSLMPTGLLDNLTDQQLVDLFAYIRSSQPLNN